MARSITPPIPAALEEETRARSILLLLLLLPPPPPPPPGEVSLQAIDGGPNYLQGFANPLDATKFPIGVWLECAVDANAVNMDKAVGLNLYVAICGNANEWQYVVNGGMRVFPQSELLTRGVSFGAETAGWMNSDEIDMTQGAPGCQTVKNRNSLFPADGRLRYANFGKGVAYWLSNTEAACFVNAVDVPSADVYWFSDNNACGAGEAGTKPGVVTANRCHVAANYSWLVNRERSLIQPAGSKPVWAFVEVGCPFGPDWPCIRIEQIKPAVWHSIIAGAQGIVYFNHSFSAGAGNGACGTSSHTLRECAPLRPAVTAINAQVQSLASVLRSPSLSSGFSANANVRALAKWNGQNFYVLAATAGHIGPVAGSFSIPCVGDATATVVGESRTVPVSGGAFTDTFADPNAVHIYRIDGGSTCGLGT